LRLLKRLSGADRRTRKTTMTTKPSENVKKAAEIMNVSVSDFIMIPAERRAAEIVQSHKARERRAKYFTSMCDCCKVWPCKCR